MRTKKLLSLLLAMTMLVSLFAAVPVLADEGIMVAFHGSNLDEGWWVPYFLQTNGDKLETNVHTDKYIDTVQPEISFTLQSEEGDVLDVTTGSQAYLSKGKTYTVTQTDAETNHYDFVSDNIRFTISEDGTLAWVDGASGGLIEAGNAIVWFDVSTEYEAHTYNLEWPENAYQRKVSLPIYVGETQVAGLIFEDDVNSVTFDRLKYAANGVEIEYEVKLDEINDSFWSLFKVKDIETEGNITTVTLDHVTYEVPVTVAEGVQCCIKDNNNTEIWNSTSEGNPVLNVGYIYSIEFTEVPEGYERSSQSIAIDQANILRYNDTLIDENVKEGEIPTVNIAPNVASYSITVLQAENGTVSADKTSAAKGETVTVTVTANDGYAVDAFTVTNETETVETVRTDEADAVKYTFEMPANDVTVTATFVSTSVDPIPEPSAHSHPVCGDAECVEHTGLPWVEITQGMVDAGLTLAADTNYYLGSDITATADVILPAGESALCLNGHKWDVGYIDNAAFHYAYGNSGTFSICDCSAEETGEIISSETTIAVDERCTVNIYGGCVKSSNYHAIMISTISTANGEVGGLLNMYGGTVTTGNGYAQTINNTGIFNLYGGSVEGKQALVTNSWESEAHLYGGSISGGPEASDFAINMFGDVYLAGDVKINGNIQIWANDDGVAQFVIVTPMTNTAPLNIDATYFGEYNTFTRGWADNMAEANPEDYFSASAGGESKTIYVNPMGELWLSEGHEHPVCGDADCEDHEDVSWIPMTKAMLEECNGELSAGNYFLVENIDTDISIELHDEVNLCFNNYILTATDDNIILNLWEGGTSANLCDCGTYGGLRGDYSGESFAGNIINVETDTELNIYGGTYQAYNTGDSAQLIRSWGHVNIYDGSFTSTGASGVFLEGNYEDMPALVNFYGGTFDSSRSTETYVTLWGAANIYGGNFIAGEGVKAIDIGGTYRVGFNGAATVDGYIDIRESCLLEIKEAMQEVSQPYTILTSSLGEIKYEADWDEDGNPIYEIITPADPYADFTTGWSTYMPEADPSEYFVGRNGEKAVAGYSGEVHFAKAHDIDINASLIGGTITADVDQAIAGDTVTLTITPSENFEMISVTVTDENGNEIETTEVTDEGEIVLFAAAESTNYSFTMPDSAVYVTAEFARAEITSNFVINADVDTSVTDVVAETTEITDVYSGTVVAVNISVSGGAFTSADWKLVYESNKFEYLYAETNAAYDGICTFDLDDWSLSNVLSGKVYGDAGYDANKTDEFAENDVIVTYYFLALPQENTVTGNFRFIDAHANTYQMAANQDNTKAATKAEAINIVLNEVAAGGYFYDETVTYNGLLQKLNPVELEDEFLDATVTYLWADGNWYTEMPEYKEVGAYPYTAKITGAGLSEKILEATLTIEPLEVYPTARFNVDPDVNSIKVTPVIEGVVDSLYKGSVEVVLTLNGVEIDRFTIDDMNEFIFDGESSAVWYTEYEVLNATTSGELVATVTYTASTSPVDNYYATAPGEASVDLDKLTVDKGTVEEIDRYVVNSEFEYDGDPHYVEIDENYLEEIGINYLDPAADWTYTITDAFDENIVDGLYVTEVGEDKLVKVTFIDQNNAYNDVVVYTVLKVVPREIIITVDDATKKLGEEDPDFTWTFTLVSDYDVPSEDVLVNDNDLGEITAVRERGETAGDYEVTVKYTPNKNYTVTVVPGTLTIGAPDFVVEVVDPSRIYGEDYTPDYIAGHRLILVYTNGNKAYFQYDGKNMFDVTEAGYAYYDNNYGEEYGIQHGTYAHVYGVVVAADIAYDPADPAASEAAYKARVSFAGSEEIYAPIKVITYDENVNMSGNLDINDYSTTNGVYNVLYNTADYIESIFKADYTKDKMVDSNDAWEVKWQIEYLTGE